MQGFDSIGCCCVAKVFCSDVPLLLFAFGTPMATQHLCQECWRQPQGVHHDFVVAHLIQQCLRLAIDTVTFVCAGPLDGGSVSAKFGVCMSFDF